MDLKNSSPQQISKKIRIAQKVKEIMDILEIEENDSTEGTPMRVAKMYVDDIFRNVNNQGISELDDTMTFFQNKNTCESQLVIVKDIPFYSTCEHHFMPFHGKITIGYLPGSYLIGLSKIPRVVKFFSKKPQLQERLVCEIADYLQEHLGTDALFVLSTDCVHTCVTARGIETYCETDSLEMRGCFAKECEEQFFRRIKR